MYLTVLGFKGGVGKTTTALHLCGALHTEDEPALLIDGDANRSALLWAQNGLLPFRVVDERAGIRAARDFAHVVIDTAARPTPADLEALAQACDFLVLPTPPEAMALNAVLATRDALQSYNTPHAVLLTLVPPKPSRDGDDAHSSLASAGVPILHARIARAAAYPKASLAGKLVGDVDDVRARACARDYAAACAEIRALYEAKSGA